MEGELGKQVGPLPVGGWLVVGVAGVGFGLYMRKHFGATTATTGADGPLTTTAGGSDTATAGNLYQPTTGASIGDGIGTPSYANNADWRSSVERWLLAHNYNPTLIDSAVSKYLTGGTLSASEQALIDLALQYGGPTPDQVPTPIIDQTPITPPVANPAPTTPVDTTAPTPTPAAPVPTPLAAVPAVASANPAPGTAVAVPNPIPGDASSVVVGKTSDGYGYTYGGSAAQAADLIAASAPTVLSAQQVMPAADGVGRQYVDSGGYTFTYG